MICLLFFSAAHATSAQEHARTLASQAQNIAQTTSPSTIPGFKTDAPPETAFNDHHALEAATANVLTHNEAAQFVQKSAETRPYFQIDIEKDPIIENSLEAIQNPEKVLETPIENRETSTEYDIITCQESKPSIEVTCSKNLLPPEFWVEPAKYSNWWCAAGNHRPDDPSCSAKAYYNPARMYEPEHIHIQKESWTSTCQTLEEKAKRGICKLVKQECPGGCETREVVGKLGDKAVTRLITRDCWRYEITYVCSHPSPNTCEALRKQGCEQIQSECLTKIGNTCVEWNQTYRCPKQKSASSSRPICRSQSPAYSCPAYGKIEAGTLTRESPNTDLNEVVSKLQILREIQDEMRASGDPQAPPPLFKGNRGACTIAFAGFKNCCTDGNGWGVSLGLSGCGKEDTDLAERKQKGLVTRLAPTAQKKYWAFVPAKNVSPAVSRANSPACFTNKAGRSWVWGGEMQKILSAAGLQWTSSLGLILIN